MFLQPHFQRLDNCRTCQSRIVPNMVLKMPISISPFMKPLNDYSPQLDDSMDFNLPSDLSRLTSNPSCPFTQQPESISNMQFFTLNSRFTKLPKKQKKSIFQSRRKTLLKIISQCKQNASISRKQRKYLVEYRFGNEAKTYTELRDQKNILQEDPQLLIEILIARRKRRS